MLVPCSDSSTDFSSVLVINLLVSSLCSRPMVVQVDSLRRLSSLALLKMDSDALSKKWTSNNLLGAAWSEKDFASDMIGPRSLDVGLF